MFRVPRTECEPAPLLFARLLRCPADGTGALFGDDVGVELIDSPQAGLGMDEAAVRVEERPRPAIASEMKALLLGTLGNNRGVLTGLPAIDGLSSKAQERICALSSKAVAGRVWWWLWWLKRTPFSRRDSYSYRSNEVTYRVGGDATQSFDWFPGGVTYGTKPGRLAAYLNFGLSVYVRELPPARREPEYEAQIQQLAVPLYLQLDAATHGLSPAVFAAFVVNNADDYTLMEKHRLPSDAASEGLDTSRQATRVTAVITVCQVHTFRLSDMLKAYAGMGPEENRLYAKQVLSQAMLEISAKVEKLAALKILKLSMTPDSIVFCPELRESSDDQEEWEVLGHAFRTGGFDVIAGKPFFVDFDHRVAKRLQGQSGYDASCAYMMMMLVLLGTIRAQYGSAYPDVLEVVLQAGAFKAAQAEAADKMDAFRAMFLTTFQHARVERDPLPKSVLHETVDDFAVLIGRVNAGTGSMCSSCGKRTAFVGLMLWLLDTSAYSPTGVASEEEDTAADADQHRKAMQRVQAVIDARRARLATRKAKQ